MKSCYNISWKICLMLSWLLNLQAVSSVGKRIFRDLRSKIYVPTEEKTSADGENGRLIALK